ncbi:MAG TPA: MT-A70 family methyltransferase [Candidatus Wunengus sp. YC60]|uniref:MT-A70 family methyltransferase n=1 Tax=Candidatus Wunengus sp. YC60 TaxID=3367697 RepID=UPI00402A38B2
MSKYKIIYADPPWQFNNKNTGGNLNSGASAHYPTMTIKDLCNMPVKDIADDNSVLLMWWVASQPKEAIALVEAWGFTIKTMTAFNWVKTTKTGKLDFGMGFWTRAGSECCLLAVKGKPKRINAGIRAVIQAERGKHSEKPHIFREQIVKLMGDQKRIELFARHQFEGWDVFGNEVENSINI